MNMKIIVTFFLASTLFVLSSCKDNEKSKPVSNKKDQDTDVKYSNDFSVTLRAKVTKKDIFQIFYIQDPSEPYTAEQLVSAEVLPDSEFQVVEIILPNNAYPYNFRLDLGTNKEQESVQIETLTLNYKNESYSIEGKDIPKYFTLNEGVEIGLDPITFMLKTHLSGTNTIYDPHIIGKPELNEVIYSKL